jgi:hypothetical protein
MSVETNYYYVSIQEPRNFGPLAWILPELIKHRYRYMEVDAVGVGSTIEQARQILAGLTADPRHKEICCKDQGIRKDYTDFD